MEHTIKGTSVDNILETSYHDLVTTRLENTFKSLLLSGGGHKYPEMVSVEEASVITRYSKNSLYQMHLKGKVPGAKKVGGKLLFETKALQEWVKNGGRV